GVQSPLPHFRGRLCRLFQMSASELGLALDPPAAPEPPPAETSLENRARHDLLAQVHRYWIRTELAAGRDRLPSTDLARVERPAAVDDPVRPVPPSEQPDRPLAHGTTIAAAYRAAGEQLVLLGDPGAGKTTLMLELAEALLARAEQDPAH